MRFQTVLGLVVLFSWVSGCQDTCEEALKKAKTCWNLTNPKKEINNADPPIFLQVCKAEEKKFAKCLKIKNCGEYAKCISQAAADPRAVEILKQAPAPADMPADAPAQPAPADMPADAPAQPAPADMPADMPAQPAPADMPADMPAQPAPADMPATPSMQ